MTHRSALFPLAILVLLAAPIGFAYGQTRTFDIATFSLPEGWNAEQRGTVFVVRHVDEGSHQYCQVLIHTSQPGTGNLSEDFVREWQRTGWGRTSGDAPKPTATHSFVGFDGLQGGAPVEQAGRRSYVHLIVVAVPPRVMSVVLLAPDPQALADRYASSVKAFLGSMRFAAATAPPAAGATRPAAQPPSARHPTRPPDPATAGDLSQPGLAAAPQVEPRLVGRWDYDAGKALHALGEAHLDLRADGTFEYTSIVVIQTGSYVTGSRYAQAYKYQGRYKASGNGAVLFYAIGKGKLQSTSQFENFVELVRKLETKNARANDREYRWTLDGSGDTATFAATDGRTDQAEDLNGLNGGPFHRKK